MRTDTGEIVGAEDMTEDEKQERLFDEKAEFEEVVGEIPRVSPYDKGAEGKPDPEVSAIRGYDSYPAKRLGAGLSATRGDFLCSRAGPLERPCSPGLGSGFLGDGPDTRHYSEANFINGKLVSKLEREKDWSWLFERHCVCRVKPLAISTGFDRVERAQAWPHRPWKGNSPRLRR